MQYIFNTELLSLSNRTGLARKTFNIQNIRIEQQVQKNAVLAVIKPIQKRR